MTEQPDAISTPAHSVRIGSPGALLAIIPHLLGFVPGSSLVILGTDPPGGEVKITMRYDLPDPGDPDVAADLAGHAVSILASQGLAMALAAGYGPGPLVTPLVNALRDAAAQAGIGLAEVLRAEDGRYWSYTCTSASCCPAEGTPYDTAARTVTPVPAGGSPVLASRDVLAATLAPIGGTTADSMRLATRRAEQHILRLLRKAGASGRREVFRRLVDGEGTGTVRALVDLYRAGNQYRSYYQLAWLTVVLRDLRVRDDAWARMDPRFRQAHLRLWTDVVRHARPGYVAAPASLLAFVAWQSGNGALANVALDRAQADDPRYSMADLLRQVISSGAPPSMARLPMTPEEVAAEYEAAEDEDPADSTDQDDEHQDDEHLDEADAGELAGRTA